MENVLNEQLKTMRRRRLYDGSQTIRDMSGEVLLEGRVDPSLYYEKFGIPETFLNDKTVLVLGCGAGAVCFDMVRRGAAKVYGIEKDPQLIEGHGEICEIIKPLSPILVIKANFNNVATMTMSLTEVENFPAKFDYVFCLTLLENVQYPANLVKWIGGVTSECAYFEVIDGKQNETLVNGPVNSWRPTKDAFTRVMKKLGGFGEVSYVGEGKAKGRNLYVATRPSDVSPVVNIKIEAEKKIEPVKPYVAAPAPAIETRIETMVRSGATFAHLETKDGVIREASRKYDVAREKKIDAVVLPGMDDPLTDVADIAHTEQLGDVFTGEELAQEIEDYSDLSLSEGEAVAVVNDIQPRKKLKKRGDK